MDCSSSSRDWMSQGIVMYLKPSRSRNTRRPASSAAREDDGLADPLVQHMRFGKPVKIVLGGMAICSDIARAALMSRNTTTEPWIARSIADGCDRFRWESWLRRPEEGAARWKLDGPIELERAVRPRGQRTFASMIRSTWLMGRPVACSSTSRQSLGTAFKT